MKKKILITGAAGFIGSQLGYYLNNLGYEVSLLDNLSFGFKNNLEIDGKTFGTFILDDIRSDKFEDYLDGVDTVFHFAAIAPLPVCQTNPKEAFDNNVSGWANVLEACRKKKIRKIVFASTSALYENNTSFPAKEEDVVSPHLTYSITKKHGEDLAHSYSKLYGMNITILRFFNCYGPHHDFRRKSPPLIAYIIKCMMKDEVPILHSNGEQKRDYIYVSDVCKMCKISIDDPNSDNETFNVASGNVISMNDIYKKISSLMGKNIVPIFREPILLWDKYAELNKGRVFKQEYIEKETNKYCVGSNDKARNILKWEPEITFDEGIKLTVEYAVKKGL